MEFSLMDVVSQLYTAFNPHPSPNCSISSTAAKQVTSVDDVYGHSPTRRLAMTASVAVYTVSVKDYIIKLED